MEKQLQRAKLLSQHQTPEFAETIRQSMTRTWDETNTDVDGSLYSGAFFNQHDKQRFAKIQSSPPEKLSQFAGLFDDERADEILFRYRARNFPETLSAQETEDWQTHISQRLHDNEAPWLSATEFDQIMKSTAWNENENELRESLERFAKSILANEGAGADKV